MARIVVYLCAVLLGATLMGFEMVASRYLTPYFGSGIFTWAALISAVLFSIMAGYFLGGFTVDRFPSFKLAALFSALAGLWLLLVPVFSWAILEHIMLSIQSEVIGVLIGSFALLIFPITALGTFSPIALRMLLRDLRSTGSTAGKVYGISTFGNIAGTLGTVVVLVPRYGSDTITLIFAGTAIACAVALFALSRHEKIK